jgi:hypothetical protein
MDTKQIQDMAAKIYSVAIGHRWEADEKAAKRGSEPR